MPKPLTVWITINCGKFCKRWDYQTTLPAPGEIWMQVNKEQLELDMEQQTGSKLKKEYIRAVCCHPAYLTYMQSTSCKMPGWMKHKLESRLLECWEPAWGTPPVAKVMRKEARHTQRRDRASGVPLEILEHLPPKPESAYFTALCSHLHLWLYAGLSPTTTSLWKRVKLQLQLIKFLGMTRVF